MKTYQVLFILLGLFITQACNHTKEEQTPAETVKTTTPEPKPDHHTSQISLDWKGTYTGTLPCADCDGIKTTIRLNDDMSYDAVAEYLGKKDAVFETRGYYKWEDDGQTILLSDENETRYKVGENKLIQLDKSGNVVTGSLANFYILTKQTTSTNQVTSLTSTRWKLVKLMGQDITESDAFIAFETNTNNVYGSTGCNSFNGTFKITNEFQLELSELATTMKACPDEDMAIETNFLEVLNTSDNFSVNNNTMTLNKAKMMPLAVFKATI
ncbi:copper resistance protein NlpE N-terminal domain-containing protein [Bizionia sediminis]|uniref:Copper resistance protein NlpE N-terminal domain-containing protein n=1 Tax=Bizionia sediminis TaxID=1737064 RepID=A0ABW5KUQ2_9FLAO